MADPRIEQLLNVLRTSVTEASDGELPLAKRRAFYRMISEVYGDAAPQRRASLALACARKIARQWDSRWPDDPTVTNLLALADDVLADSQPADTLKRLLQNAQTHVDNQMGEEDGLVAGYAGYSALSAAYVVLYDEKLSDPGSEDEGEMDPQDWDAAFLASLAETGGAVWEDGFDPEARRGFWLWYLDTAAQYLS